jgi:hypothetical protein
MITTGLQKQDADMDLPKPAQITGSDPLLKRLVDAKVAAI